MRRVIVESPYAGDVEKNLAYARACIRDYLVRGEAPFASHLLYTQPGVLRDEVPEERQWGIEAGFVWGLAAEATVVYTDYGISEGMLEDIKRADREGRKIEYRKLFSEEDKTDSREPKIQKKEETLNPEVQFKLKRLQLATMEDSNASELLAEYIDRRNNREVVDKEELLSRATSTESRKILEEMIGFFDELQGKSPEPEI